MEHEGAISIYLNISQSLNISKYIFQDISGIKSHCCLSLLAGKPLSTEVLWGAGGWGIGVRGSVRNPVRRLADACRRYGSSTISVSKHNVDLLAQLGWRTMATTVLWTLVNPQQKGFVSSIEVPCRWLRPGEKCLVDLWAISKAPVDTDPPRFRHDEKLRHIERDDGFLSKVKNLT